MMGNTGKPTVYEAAHPKKSKLHAFNYSFVHSLMSEAQDTNSKN